MASNMAPSIPTNAFHLLLSLENMFFLNLISLCPEMPLYSLKNYAFIEEKRRASGYQFKIIFV